MPPSVAEVNVILNQTLWAAGWWWDFQAAPTVWPRAKARQPKVARRKPASCAQACSGPHSRSRGCAHLPRPCTPPVTAHLTPYHFIIGSVVRYGEDSLTPTGDVVQVEQHCHVAVRQGGPFSRPLAVGAPGLVGGICCPGFRGPEGQPGTGDNSLLLCVMVFSVATAKSQLRKAGGRQHRDHAKGLAGTSRG